MNLNNMEDENTQNQNERKYLDLQGLQTLWDKISGIYPRTANLSTILDALEDPYVHKSVHDADVTRLEEQIAATTGNALAMDGDTIWYNSDKKAFQTNLIMDLDPTKKTLRLVTKDPDITDKVQAKTIISEIDYTPFVKDGMLSSATIVVIPDDEEATQSRPAGTYIKFVFNTDAGKEAIYLDVNEFNIYQGSDYISIQGDVITLNTVELDSHIENYLKESSLTISGIINRLDGYDTSIQTIQSTVGEIQTGFSQLTETVLVYGTRVQNIEDVLKTVPNTPITEDEIDKLT